MPDIVIPIVFPDYIITVETPKVSLEIPDLIPRFDILPDKVSIPKIKNRFPELGHSGALFIDGIKGTTKYYEYGRYGGPEGSVRKRLIRNATMQDGHPTKASLSYTLSQISAKSGHNGRISGAYIEAPGKFQSMLNYAVKRHKENSNPNRKPYDLFNNSCNHFMQGIMLAADLDLPYMFDPRPNSFINEIRDVYPDLDYSKAEHSLNIEDAPTALAYSYGLTQSASA